MAFEIGQKVELNALGRTRVEGDTVRPKNRRNGEIVGISKAYPGSYRIKWETRKGVDQLHGDFIADAAEGIPLPGLRECPFCGDTATTAEGDGHWYVACTNVACFCAFGEGYDRDAMPNHSFTSEADAMSAWNKRK